ncbi:GNAT family N-acetyltransferase [Ammoniphilus sp. CFH 90114]|uniref:GNAT family N-acetyltransferase n=1 Tax=Ammoniphilus sp. CFH 90114 TaxID=2493665 RepID=UPI00100E4248|nr:GNAT family N-acetyltransferase [Ammoniphilus sp. CFH 90114]RXT07030.1 GNAT family N-acetyltransferase [Ammoniphilus sp. CFH 90114]
MIRKYEEQDLEEIINIFIAASRLAHSFVSEEFIQEEVHNIRSLYIHQTRTFVYEHNHKVIGFICLMANEIGALFVAPQWHGCGIGKDLMNYVRSLHKTLEVEVFKENQMARSFYETCGFTELKEHIHTSGHTLLRLRYDMMSLSLKKS